jgi:tetratricopeptide (TPR) repeat protein
MESSGLSNPFPGLRPFEASEGKLFFGREQEIDELLRRLNTTRFLLVAGSSGTGKSSLVRSGLIPALQGGLVATAGSKWRVVLFRPGDDPIGNMASAMDTPETLGIVGELASTNRVLVEATLQRSSLGIVQAVRLAQIPPQDNVLIVVDQFEELFRFRRSGSGNSRDEAVAFFKLLLEATKQQKIPIYVVLTMRSDFLGDCIEFQGLPEAVNAGLYLIPRMTRDELRSAITGPVAFAGGAIAQRLVMRLLNDLGDDHDQLPLLQHALMRAWDRWAPRREEEPAIDIADYEAIGGLQEAMSIHAEEAFQEASEDTGDGSGQPVAEKIFKALTDTYSDPRGVRRACSIEELTAVCEASEADVKWVVEVFRAPGRSFLTPFAGVPLDSHTIVDLSHESLMRCWTRLVAWAAEERESAAIYLRIAQAATWWGESSGGLWIDPQLETGLQWRSKNRPTAAWAARYDPNFAQAMLFLESSERQRAAERKREADRRRAWKVASCVLAVLLGAIGTLASVAVKKSSLATRNLALAQKAVDESLSSAGAQQAREAPDSAEMEEFRKELLDKAKTFYLNFAEQDHGDAAVAQMAMGHSHLGDIDRLLQANDDAVKEYNEAISGYAKLSHEHPSNPDYREQLAYCYNWLGETLRLWLESDHPPASFSGADAEKQYNAAIVLQKALQQGAPANRVYPQELARSYYNLGIVLLNGHDVDGAEADFQLAAGLLKPLIGGNRTPSAPLTNGPDPAQDLARVYNNLGVVDLLRKSYAPAEQLFQQAVGSLQTLLQTDPANREYNLEMAKYENNLAAAFGDEGQFAAAANATDSARRIADNLADPGPGVNKLSDKIDAMHLWIEGRDPEIMASLGRDYAQLARDDLRAGNLPGAEKALDNLTLLLPKLAPADRPGLTAAYTDLHKKVSDISGK